MTELTTSLPAVTLTALQLTDAAALAVLGNNRKIWLMVHDRFPQPYWYIDAERYVAKVMQQRQQLTWAIRKDGNLVGIIGVEPGADINKKTMEVGYWIGEPYWGQGIATAALEALTAHLFATFDIVRIQARVFPVNIACQRVLEKAGYRHEATLEWAVFKAGELMDDHVYARLKNS